MHILFVVPYVPSLIRPRSYNLIQHLMRRGHRVTLATVWTGDQEQADARRLVKEGWEVESFPLERWRSVWNCLRAIPTLEPLQAHYCWQPRLARQLNALVQPGADHPAFDIIHVEHLRGVRYGLYLQSQHCNVPIVWDSVDCISYLFRQASGKSQNRLSRWLTHFELSRTERYEGRLVGKFDQVLVTSVTDKNELCSLSALGKDCHNVAVVPNGVDLDYFYPEEATPREPDTLVVSGKMSYHANAAMVQHLVNDVMPLVWAQRPGVKLWIVGKDPTDAIKKLSKNGVIRVTGTVPDLRPYLRRALISVAPVVYGAGVQNKVLESMACATPVIATPKAVSALDVVPGRDLLVAENPDEFAAAILHLIQYPDDRWRLGQAGRDYVINCHQWQTVAAKLERIYDEVVNIKRHPASTG
jgi:sugar transferase (PEP-CTERM/EpsH1 system associated)